MLNGEKQNDSSLKWFTGMRHSPLRAFLVTELMSKQFITHLFGPFLEPYKGILYVCGTQDNECDGLESGEKL